MIKAWDADGHVSESEVTFSDKYWDPKLKDRRPTIIETGPDGKTMFRQRAVYARRGSIADVVDWLAEDFKDVHVIFLHSHDGNVLHSATEEITSFEQLAGKKLRTPSRTGAWVIESWGAEPVGMPVPELPQALAKGVVEAPREALPLALGPNHRARCAGAAAFGAVSILRFDSFTREIYVAFQSAQRTEAAALGMVLVVVMLVLFAIYARVRGARALHRVHARGRHPPSARPAGSPGAARRRPCRLGEGAVRTRRPVSKVTSTWSSRIIDHIPRAVSSAGSCPLSSEKCSCQTSSQALRSIHSRCLLNTVRS